MTVANPFAFPVSEQISDSHPDYQGMTLRDWFAGQAMSHALSASASHDGCYNPVAAAWGAYSVADAMLAARNADAPPAEAAAPVVQDPDPILEICADCEMPVAACDCIPF